MHRSLHRRGQSDLAVDGHRQRRGPQVSAAKRAVVLLSGGLDSATVLAIARSQGYELYALSFSYGQRHIVELDAARRVSAAIGVADHRFAAIDLRVFGGSALTADISVPKGRDADEMSHGI